MVFYVEGKVVDGGHALYLCFCFRCGLQSWYAEYALTTKYIQCAYFARIFDPV